MEYLFRDLWLFNNRRDRIRGNGVGGGGEELKRREKGIKDVFYFRYFDYVIKFSRVFKLEYLNGIVFKFIFF